MLIKWLFSQNGTGYRTRSQDVSIIYIPHWHKNQDATSDEQAILPF